MTVFVPGVSTTVVAVFSFGVRVGRGVAVSMAGKLHASEASNKTLTSTRSFDFRFMASSISDPSEFGNGSRVLHDRRRPKSGDFGLHLRSPHSEQLTITSEKLRPQMLFLNQDKRRLGRHNHNLHLPESPIGTR